MPCFQPADSSYLNSEDLFPDQLLHLRIYGISRFQQQRFTDFRIPVFFIGNGDVSKEDLQLLESTFLQLVEDLLQRFIFMKGFGKPYIFFCFWFVMVF